MNKIQNSWKYLIIFSLSIVFISMTAYAVYLFLNKQGPTSDKGLTIDKSIAAAEVKQKEVAVIKVSENLTKSTSKDYNSKQIIVKFKTEQKDKFLSKNANASKITLLGETLPNTYIATIANGVDIKSLITDLNKDESIIYAEPDYLMTSQAGDKTIEYYNRDYKIAFSYTTPFTVSGNISGSAYGDISKLIAIGNITSNKNNDSAFDGIGVYVAKNYTDSLLSYVELEKQAWAGRNTEMGNPSDTPSTTDISIGGVVGKDLKGYFWDNLERIYVKLPDSNNILEITVSKEDSTSFAQLQTMLDSFKFNYTPTTPVTNDPLIGQQWNLEKIKAPEAWQLEGTNQVIVADIDTGIRSNHPDLTDKIWTNLKEIPSNGIDDDQNGIVDDVYGIQAGSLSSSSLGISVKSDKFGASGHGTWTSSIIGATRDNSEGISGVCNNCLIMQVVGGISGPAETPTDEQLLIDETVTSIKYAVDNGAKVINASWGAIWYSNALQDAVNYAYDHNVVFVAAAGNLETDEPFYPADMDNVISVTSINQQNQKVQNTRFGYKVTIAAPATNLTLAAGSGSSLYINSLTSFGSSMDGGTSFAAPHVAGVAALILSRHPELTPDQIRDILTSTADSASLNGSQYYIGAGIVDAYKAIQVDTANDVKSSIDFPIQGATVSSQFDIKGTADDATFNHYDIYYGYGFYPTTWTKAYTNSINVSEGTLMSNFDPIVLSKGINTMKLEVFDNTGDSKVSYLRVNY